MISEFTTRAEVSRRNTKAQALGYQSFDDQMSELRKLQDTARKVGIFMGEAVGMVSQATGHLWDELTFQECGTVETMFRNNRRTPMNPERRDVSIRQASLFWRIMGRAMDYRNKQKVETFAEWFSERWMKKSGSDLDQFLQNTLNDMEARA